MAYIVSQKCDCCGNMRFTVEKRQRNTSYNDETMNELISCVECWAQDYEYYAERWAEYYNGCL